MLIVLASIKIGQDLNSNKNVKDIVDVFNKIGAKSTKFNTF